MIAHVSMPRRATRARERRAWPRCRAANRFRSPCSPSHALRAPRLHRHAPMSELTAVENGSYPNDIDALRSSPLAAPQGPGVPVTSPLLKKDSR
ncbi:hypothetical protein NL30_07580 [Burkholderia contaminans]|nr:hypothetical protein NL30_07580 [Burkholderia contaminans]